MNALEPNVPLLRKAVEWVEAEAAKPEIDREWNQGSWLLKPFDRARIMVEEVWGLADVDEVWELAARVAPACGTAYCVAGYVAQLTDERFVTDQHVNDPDDPRADLEGDIHCSQVAREALGLTQSQADALFDAFNSAATVRAIAEEIAGESL